MRIQIDTHSDSRAVPQSLYRGKRRIKIIEIMDQWYGPVHRYVKVRAHDGSMYILRLDLRLDEVSHQWKLIMFSAAPAQEWQCKYHDMARSAQSRQ
jgi:hypothetical protein